MGFPVLNPENQFGFKDGWIYIFPAVRLARESDEYRTIQHDHTLKPLVGRWKARAGGFILSFLANFIWILVKPLEYEWVYMLTLTVVLPFLIAVIVCLIRTAPLFFRDHPARMRRLATGEQRDPEVYLVHALAPVLLSHEVFEETVDFVMGLFFGYIGFLLAEVWFNIRVDDAMGEAGASFYIIFLAYTLITFLWLPFLLAFTSSIYRWKLSPWSVTALSILHTLAVLLVSLGLSLMLTMLLEVLLQSNWTTPLLLLVYAILLHLLNVLTYIIGRRIFLSSSNRTAKK